MLDTPRTWRYQSAVLLGPRPKLPDQPNRGPEEGWGAPFERPPARSVLHGAPAAENIDLYFRSSAPPGFGAPARNSRYSRAPKISSSLVSVAHAGLSTSVAIRSPGLPRVSSGWGGKGGRVCRRSFNCRATFF